MSVTDGALFNRPLHDLEPHDKITPRALYLWWVERKLEQAEMCKGLLSQGPGHRTGQDAEKWTAHLTATEAMCREHAMKWRGLADAQRS